MTARKENSLLLLVVLAVAPTGAFVVPDSIRSCACDISQAPSARRPRVLSMAIDPHDAAHHVQTAAEALGSGGLDPSHHLEGAMTSLTTAAADAAVIGKKYAWEFMGLHGERVSPCGGSCPPGFGLPGAEAPRMDYFLPEDPQKAIKAIEAQRQAAAAGQTVPEVGKLMDALPGGKPEVFPFSTTGYSDQAMIPYEQDELEGMLRDADIVNRIPLVAFGMVLFDFFFINSGNDVYREDMMDEESKGRARANWMMAAGSRVVVGILLTLATVAFSNMFYNPI